MSNKSDKTGSPKLTRIPFIIKENRKKKLAKRKSSTPKVKKAESRSFLSILMTIFTPVILILKLLFFILRLFSRLFYSPRAKLSESRKKEAKDKKYKNDPPSSLFSLKLKIFIFSLIMLVIAGLIISKKFASSTTSSASSIENLIANKDETAKNSESVTKSLSGIRSKVSALFFPKINRILLKGVKNVDRDAITASLYRKNDSTGRLELRDTEDIRQTIVEMPLVKTAGVTKRIPRTLLVLIKEREILLGHYDTTSNKFLSIDTEFEMVDYDFRHIGKFKSVQRNSNSKKKEKNAHITVVNKFDKVQLKEFYETLREYPQIFNNTTHIEYFLNYRWNLVLNSKTLVMLPEIKYNEALKTLLYIIHKSKILTLPIKSIDLRSKGKIFIQKFKNGEKSYTYKTHHIIHLTNTKEKDEVLKSMYHQTSKPIAPLKEPKIKKKPDLKPNLEGKLRDATARNTIKSPPQKPKSPTPKPKLTSRPKLKPTFKPRPKVKLKAKAKAKAKSKGKARAKAKAKVKVKVTKKKVKDKKYSPLNSILATKEIKSKPKAKIIKPSKTPVQGPQNLEQTIEKYSRSQPKPHQIKPKKTKTAQVNLKQPKTKQPKPTQAKTTQPNPVKINSGKNKINHDKKSLDATIRKQIAREKAESILRLKKEAEHVILK